MNEKAQDFLAAFKVSIANESFVKFSFAHYKGDEPDLKSVIIRKVLIKRAEKFSFTFRHKTRDVVKNYNAQEMLALVAGYLEGIFYSATLFTTQNDTTLDTHDGKKYQIHQKLPTHKDVPTLTHDREKNHLIKAENKPYLFDLGITAVDGQIKKDAQDKYRQINKYIEVMAGLIKDMPQDAALNIVDMGAGKGYLTFALYDYFQQAGLINAKMTGVECRDDLVRLCNDIAQKNNFQNLSFVRGSIADFDATGASVLIALHACDTATDDAIAKGIKAGAALIVVAPCCHKQIRREMEKNKPDTALSYLTDHGIFLERQAEMVTDLLRGQILEYMGYKTKIFEFISDAHTPKNVMIVAQLQNKPRKDAQIMDAIQKTKAFFGVRTHYLEKLLEN